MVNIELIQKAISLTQQGKISEAEEIYKDIQKENPDKLVKLSYTVKWSGKYKVLFMNDDGSIRDTVAEVREHMPKYYGI